MDCGWREHKHSFHNSLLQIIPPKEQLEWSFYNARQILSPSIQKLPRPFHFSQSKSQRTHCGDTQGSTLSDSMVTSPASSLKLSPTSVRFHQFSSLPSSDNSGTVLPQGLCLFPWGVVRLTPDPPAVLSRKSPLSKTFSSLYLKENWVSKCLLIYFAHFLLLWLKC